MWLMPVQRRQEFIDSAKLAEKACIQNPNDTESKKKWADALSNLGICEYTAYPEEHTDLLKEALAKLDEVLDAHPEDHEARFMAGLVYYYMLFAWPSQEENYDAKAKLVICDNAIKCFKKVIDESPEPYESYGLMEQIQRQADYYRRYKLKERVEDLLPAESAPPEAEIYESHKPTERVQDHLPVKSAQTEMMQYNDLVKYGEDTSFFMNKIALHPENAAELWKTWGTALMNVSFQESGITKRVTIAEAIVKLENALLISPNDKKAKQELMKAYDQLIMERHSSFEVEMSAGEPSSIDENEVAEQKNINKRRREA